jgi:hypothetical protein
LRLLARRALVALFVAGCGAATPRADHVHTEPMLGPFATLDARCDTTDDPSDPHADPVAPWIDDGDGCPAPRPGESFEAAGTIVRAGVVRDRAGDACRIFVELGSGRAWVATASTACDVAATVSAEIDDAEVTVHLGPTASTCGRDGPEWRCSPWATD